MVGDDTLFNEVPFNTQKGGVRHVLSPLPAYDLLDGEWIVQT